MVFKLTRDSGLPVLLEEDEIHTMKTLELQGRWTELDDFTSQLRDSSHDLKEMLIEADTLEALKFFLITIDDKHEYRINWEKKTISICDDGRNQ